MHEKSILVNGVSTNYKILKASSASLEKKDSEKIKTILILHGWSSNSNKWQPLAESLIAQNIICVIPDLPGFGKSETPQKAWNIDDYVKWLNEFCSIVPELKKEFNLLGHSFGGAIASKFTVKYNQRVKKLFLVSAALVRPKTTIKKTSKIISKLVKIFSFVPYYSFLRKAIYKYILKKSDYAYLQGILKEIYLKVIAEDLSQYISFIKTPTIIIWGSEDNYTQLEQAYFINKKIEKSKLEIIPKANHALQIKNLPQLTEKIIKNI